MAQKIIDIDAAKPIESTVAELGLPRRPLIVLLGDFDSKLNSQVGSICRRVIAPAALEPGALILDNARCAGCAALIATAALEQDKPVALLGIIPSDRAPTDIDGDHEIVLRLPATWADATKYTFQIADELVKDGAAPKPAVAVLFGGAGPEKKALVRCARRGWPVLVMEGSGGLADQVLDASAAGPDGTAASLVADPDLREILETASIYPSSMDASVDELSRILLGRIDERPEMLVSTLTEAWTRFDELDVTAVLKRTTFLVTEMALITLAVLAALFAILTAGPNAVSPAWRWWLHTHGMHMGRLHLLVLSTPITISIIAAYSSHFRDGNKWILLRGAAEALKSEIFRFRAKAGGYSDEQCRQTSRDLKLAARIKDISSALEQSEVNKMGLRAPPPNRKERASFLSPDEYVEARLQDQVKHFTKKTRRLSRKLFGMQLLVYMAGAAGTFLSAVQLDIWVALATAFVTALMTKLQADQVENSLMQHNRALASLRNVHAWWTALSAWEKVRRKNIDVLVDQTEKALESETAGWVRQMQSALDKLTVKEPRK